MSTRLCHTYKEKVAKKSKHIYILTIIFIFKHPGKIPLSEDILGLSFYIICKKINFEQTLFTLVSLPRYFGHHHKFPLYTLKLYFKIPVFCLSELNLHKYSMLTIHHCQRYMAKYKKIFWFSDPKSYQLFLKSNPQKNSESISCKVCHESCQLESSELLRLILEALQCLKVVQADIFPKMHFKSASYGNRMLCKSDSCLAVELVFESDRPLYNNSFSCYSESKYGMRFFKILISTCLIN